jgi:hypothetical protein
VVSRPNSFFLLQHHMVHSPVSETLNDCTQWVSTPSLVHRAISQITNTFSIFFKMLCKIVHHSMFYLSYIASDPIYFFTDRLIGLTSIARMMATLLVPRISMSTYSESCITVDPNSTHCGMHWLLVAFTKGSGKLLDGTELLVDIISNTSTDSLDTLI